MWHVTARCVEHAKDPGSPEQPQRIQRALHLTTLTDIDPSSEQMPMYMRTFVCPYLGAKWMIRAPVMKRMVIAKTMKAARGRGRAE